MYASVHKMKTEFIATFFRLYTAAASSSKNVKMPKKIIEGSKGSSHH
jgi:hypothetical protein